jgi:hypothetical protein
MESKILAMHSDLNLKLCGLLPTSFHHHFIIIFPSSFNPLITSSIVGYFLLKADVVVAIFLLAIVLNVNTTISTLKDWRLFFSRMGSWLVVR